MGGRSKEREGEEKGEKWGGGCSLGDGLSMAEEEEYAHRTALETDPAGAQTSQYVGHVGMEGGRKTTRREDELQRSWGADHPIPKGLRAASAFAVTNLMQQRQQLSQEMAGGSQVNRVRPGRREYH